MTPAIRAIRKKYPNAHLACLAAPRGVALLEGNPHLNEVIPLEERRGVANWVWLWRARGVLRPKRFDAAYLFHRSFSRTLVAALAGIPVRVGFATWKRGWLLTQSAPMPARDSLHKAEWFLKLLSHVGIESDGMQYDAGILPEDEAFAEKLLSEWKIPPGTRMVALHAGANWKLKCWPAKSFAELADRLFERFSAQPIFIGGQDDRPLIQEIAGHMRSKAVVAAGATSFRQMGALLKRVKLLISNDSGPLHMGVAVATPVIALFGPTQPELTGPPKGALAVTLFGSIGCPVPCYKLDCSNNLCMQKITVEQILSAAEKSLG